MLTNSNHENRYELKQENSYRTNRKENIKTYALITGASSGIGRAIAREFACLGYNVLLVALPDTGVERVADEIREEFQVYADAFACDLTDPGSPERVYQWCRSNEFSVNILVNNAGTGHMGAFEEMQVNSIQYILTLNNQALVLLTHQFLPELKQHSKAYILNVGSLASFEPMPYKAVYAATKSFVYSFSLALYMELQDQGISVSCLCPNGVLTNNAVKLRNQAIPISKSFLLDPETVAREAVYGLLQHQFRIIPGWQNRFVYRLEKVLPAEAKHWLMKKLFNKPDPVLDQQREITTMK